MEIWRGYLGPKAVLVWEVLREDVLNFEERASPLVAMRFQPSISGEVGQPLHCLIPLSGNACVPSRSSRYCRSRRSGVNTA